MDQLYFTISLVSTSKLNDIKKYKTVLSTYENKTYKYPKAINEKIT